MDFKKYQELAKTTAIYPDNVRVLYPALGLAGETGEVCEKIKKVYRDNNGVFTEDKVSEIKKELGDILWYIQALSNDLNLDMDEVAQLNIEKLFSRKERGVISGNGDNR